MKVILWILFGLSIAVAAVTGATIDYSSLDPAQQETAKFTLVGFFVFSGFFAGLEIWKLLDKNHSRDHISPVISRLLLTNGKFRIFFASVLTFVVILTLHFLGVF